MKMVRVAILPMLALCSFPALAGQGRLDATAPTIYLQQKSTVAIQAPPFGSYSTLCDASGDAFFDHMGLVYAAQAVLRVNPQTGAVFSFAAPADLLAHPADWQFTADGSGGVYLLFSAHERHALIHESSTGSVLSRGPISLPTNSVMDSFAVIPGKAAMFHGSVPATPTSAARDLVPFAAWLDASGKVVKLVREGPNFSPPALTDAAVTVGPEETFVEAQGGTVKVYDKTGKLLRTMPIPKPSQDSTITTVQAIGKEVAVMFENPVNSTAVPAGSYLEQIWLLANLETGASSSFFKMPNDFLGSGLCYMGERHFLYITGKDGKQVLMEAGD